MYHVYIPLFRSFSPCLALAREIVNRLLEPVQNLLSVADMASVFSKRSGAVGAIRYFRRGVLSRLSSRD
ncbi:hypothetical protein, partial [Chromobacterium fluminis]|uniref:hypothetical protein n=1 Tax=Chromobacterium fluminis TaxID=3044269 RepID=UPI00197D2652